MKEIFSYLEGNCETCVDPVHSLALIARHSCKCVNVELLILHVDPLAVVWGFSN